MIVCTKCGHKNGNDESFCQNPSCGAFLEWEGRSAPTGMIPPVAGPPGRSGTAPPGGSSQPPPPSGTAGRPGPGAPPPGAATRPGGAASGGPGAPPTRPATPPGGARGGGESPGESTQHFDAAAEAARPDGPPGPAKPDAIRRAEQAKQMLVRPGDKPPPAKRPQGQPEAQPPQEAQMPQQAPVNLGRGGPIVEPGQIACATCGWGNDPGRNFCRHCGANLTVPKTPTTVEPRPVRRPVDSERRLRVLLAVLGGIAILSAAVLLGLSLFRGGNGGGGGGGGGGGTETTIGGGGSGGGGGNALSAIPSSAIQVKATSASRSRVAANVIDGKLDTFWSRQVGDQLAAVTFTFDQPVKLARISIAAGASGNQFRLRHRPKQLQLRFSDNSAQEAILADQPEFQNVDVKPPRTVKSVRVVILDVFQATSGENRRLTSITEVKFYKA